MNNMTKRILSVIFASIMCVSLAAAVNANKEAATAEDVATIEDVELISEVEETVAAPSKLVFSGEVTAVEEGAIEVGGRFGKKLIASETTVILDADLAPIAAADVKAGMFAVAVHSEAATFSLPAQTVAYYIVVADSAEKLPLAAIVESTENTENGFVINSTNEMYSLLVSEDTALVPLRTRNIVTTENFSAGDVIFFNAEVLTLSIPAQGVPSRIVLVEDVLAVEETPAELPENQPAAETDVPAVEVGKAYMTALYNEKVSDTQLSVNFGGEEILLNIDENTIVMDDNFFPVDPASIKKDTPVYVVNSPAMTLSLPAQTYAYAVIASESANLPIYVKVADVSVDANGNTVVASADGSYEIVVANDTAVVPMRTRNILSVSDISIGDEMFVFAKDGVMSLSLPAVVSAQKVVMWVDNVETDVYVSEDGIKYYPLRKICEENGLEVVWNNDTRSIQVGTIPMGVYLTVGKNEYSFARMMPRELSGAPILLPDETNPGYGITYAPADFFTEILGIEIK